MASGIPAVGLDADDQVHEPVFGEEGVEVLFVDDVEVGVGAVCGEAARLGNEDALALILREELGAVGEGEPGVARQDDVDVGRLEVDRDSLSGVVGELEPLVNLEGGLCATRVVDGDLGGQVVAQRVADAAERADAHEAEEEREEESLGSHGCPSKEVPVIVAQAGSRSKSVGGGFGSGALICATEG